MADVQHLVAKYFRACAPWASNCRRQAPAETKHSRREHYAPAIGGEINFVDASIGVP
jgi:hypothetical protein